MSEKDRLLGQPFGTASNRLRKLILFDFAKRLGLDQCFHCGQRIENVDDLSIEHKEPWQGASDPRATFFDLENIAFSHLRCNNRKIKEQCPKGHLYGDLRPECRDCRDARRRHFRSRNREQDTSEYRRNKGWRN